MIITRAPMRISLGGGGTDLPAYYRKHGGYVISAAIDKYVYATVHQRFVEGFMLKYMQTEECATIDEIKHTRIRECLRLMDVQEKNLELTFMADIPAGTGLGSSSSFTVALLNALHVHKRSLTHPRELAEQACQVEIDVLKEPIGKQDQYIAAFGGVMGMEFRTDGITSVMPLRLSAETMANLEDGLMLFYVGDPRSASDVLAGQDQMEDNLDEIKGIAGQVYSALVRGELWHFGDLMHEHWEIKKERGAAITNPEIDELYDFARSHGAVGGKLVGAGGGGFLLFYTEDRKRLRQAMVGCGLREVRFKFDFEGTKVVLS